MNHSKIILVACISAFVALTTAFLGVAGTIIGSVLSSVLYNVLSEALEKPVENAKISTNFEWDVAYVFPLFVILFIQLMLILAFLSEWGFLPHIFLDIYLSIQGVADNNLYRILGLSLIVMSVYPFILKRDYVKKSDGLIILLIGLIFTARGFSDIVANLSPMLEMMYHIVDFPVNVIAFLLLIFVIHNILSNARSSQKETKIVKHKITQNDLDDLQLKQVHQRKSNRNFNNSRVKQTRSYVHRNNSGRNLHQSKTKINESSNGFQFESNDLLDDYKK